LKISNFVLGGEAIVMNLYSSLEGQRETDSDRETEKTNKTRRYYVSYDTGTVLRESIESI
jgi:hypothetical protein